MHETVLAVPLVIRPPVPAEPGQAPLLPRGRDDRPVQLTDLYATLLAAAGVASPAPPAHSRSLLGGVWPEGAQRPLVAEYDGPGEGLLGLLRGINPRLDAARLAPALRTLRRGDWRVTTGSDGRRELHDVARDPGQLRDLAPRWPRGAARLDSLLAATAPWRGFAPAGDAGLDDATRRQLRSLGYVR